MMTSPGPLLPDAAAPTRTGLVWVAIALGALAVAVVTHRPLRTLDAARPSGRPEAPVATSGVSEIPAEHEASPVEGAADADSLRAAGMAHEAAGRPREAAASYRSALRLSPEGSATAERLARLLATTKEPGLPDSEEAIRLAKIACAASDFQDPHRLDALAAALASAGHADEALAIGLTALSLLPASAPAPQVQAFAERVKQYGWRPEGTDLEAEGISDAALSRVAMIWATHEDARVRDSAAALRLARSLVERRAQAEVSSLDALAAAHAAAGEFSAAARAARQALSRAVATSDETGTAGMRQRWVQYQQQVAVRQLYSPAFVPSPGMLGEGARAYVYGLAATEMLREGRRDDASRLFRCALHENPRDGRVHSAVAGLLADEGQWTAAAGHFEAALRMLGEHASLRNELGKALEQLGRLDDAARAFESALRERPNWPLAANNLAWLLATTSQAENAGNPARAVRLAEQACEATDSQDASCLDTLGAAYAAAGRFPEAQAAARKALSRLTKDADAGHREAIEGRLQLYGETKPYRGPFASHLERGSAHLRQQAPDEAAAEFLSALQHRANDPEALYMLGVAREQQGLALHAIEIYCAALAQRPGWSAPLNHLAWLAATHADAQIRDGGMALQLATRVCGTANSPTARDLDVLAAAYAENNKFAEARWAMQEACRLASADAQCPPAVLGEMLTRRALYELGQPFRGLGRAHYQLGRHAASGGRFEEANVQFQEALKFAPDAPATLHEMGQALESLGRWREAANCYRRVALSAPQAFAAANRFVWLLASSPDETLRAPLEAVRLGEEIRDRAVGRSALDRIGACDALAAAYAGAGRFDEAQEELERALSLLPFAEQDGLRSTLLDRKDLYARKIPFRLDAPNR